MTFYDALLTKREISSDVVTWEVYSYRNIDFAQVAINARKKADELNAQKNGCYYQFVAAGISGTFDSFVTDDIPF